MAHKFTFLSVLFLVCSCVYLSSCKKDLLTPVCNGDTPTYEADIKTLIDSECATSGCHGSGSNNGDYTSYAGLLSDINNGRFEREVLTDQSMPRGSRNLNQDEINLVQCWADNGFQEN